MTNGVCVIPITIFLLSALCVTATAAPGDPIGPDFTVNPPASSVQDNPAIAVNGDGFVVAWSGELPGTTATVHARRFAADGTPVAPFPDIEVAGTEKQDNSATAIASNVSGQFAVAWSSYTRGEDLESEARIRSFAADGSPLSPVRALQAPGFSGLIQSLDVGMGADGNIVAVFSRIWTPPTTQATDGKRQKQVAFVYTVSLLSHRGGLEPSMGQPPPVAHDRNHALEARRKKRCSDRGRLICMP